MFYGLIKSIYKKFKKDPIETFWKKYNYVRLYKTKNSGNILLVLKYKLDINKIERKYNCYIPIVNEISNPIVFPHGLNGIFISKGAKIGKNCVTFQQVTIGSNTLADSKNRGAPTIGDNVYIGAGAKIIGNVRIGNNCRIGANCVVVKDLPDNSTVVLGENRIIRHEKPKDNTFIKFQM